MRCRFCKLLEFHHKVHSIVLLSAKWERRKLRMGPTDLFFMVWSFTIFLVLCTDRNLALLGAIKSICPRSQHLLCIWHISKNVLAKAKDMFPQIRNSRLLLNHGEILSIYLLYLNAMICWKCTSITLFNQRCTWTDIHLSLIFLSPFKKDI